MCAYMYKTLIIDSKINTVFLLQCVCLSTYNNRWQFNWSRMRVRVSSTCILISLSSSSSGLKVTMLWLCAIIKGTTILAEFAFGEDNLAVICNCGQLRILGTSGTFILLLKHLYC